MMCTVEFLPMRICHVFSSPPQTPSTAATLKCTSKTCVSLPPTSFSVRGSRKWFEQPPNIYVKSPQVFVAANTGLSSLTAVSFVGRRRPRLWDRSGPSGSGPAASLHASRGHGWDGAGAALPACRLQGSLWQKALPTRRPRSLEKPLGDT